ncbi:putative FtsX-related transmembrane transport protein [Pedobacter sp. BAL39]|uniref:ABC transporter permease n=1 Tax=Pedobacter sp. BAL39 TaxID=391596 RepID=UPI000155950F|nr:ABC transporter permease [Pedobacter sp. BAL39]EDM36675.1 putative FtsX-related transmembrane transport protein [Pedobacter sp. BAL39]
MFKLNLKIALRNIWKNKSAAFINMFGLSLGLAGFITILLYLNHETGFDKWDPKLKNVYKVGVHFKVNASDEWWESLPSNLVTLMRKNCPEVKSASMSNWGEEVIVHGQDYFYDLNARVVDSTFFSTFPFTFLQGDARTALHQPNSAVINRKMAMKIFGTEDVIGKRIEMGFDKKLHTITGVWDNERNPTHFWADVITNIPDPADDGWGNFSYNIYFQLHEGADAETALAKISRLFLDAKARWTVRDGADKVKQRALLTEAQSKQILAKNGGMDIQLIFEPVGKVYTSSVFYGKTRETTLYVLSGLAIFLLAIACINFTNLAMAYSGRRAREIGVKKVLGVERNTLIKQFLFETFLQTMSAFLFGLALVELLLPYFNGLLGGNISFLNHADLYGIVWQVALVFVVVTLCAGLYPAVYLSGFLPTKVLKGNFERSSKGVMIRRVLIVGQFVITCTFIICFSVMFSQLDFLRNKDIGLSRSQVVSFNMQTKNMMNMPADQFEQTRQRLMKIEGVQSVSRSSRSPWTTNGSNSGDAAYLENQIVIDDYYIDFDYFKTLNISMAAGRDFSLPNFSSDTLQMSAILNESAVRELGIKAPLGKTYKRAGSSLRIVGVVKDFNDRGFEKSIKPSHFIIKPGWTHYGSLLVSIGGADVKRTAERLAEEWKNIEAGFPVRMNWLDESFAKNIAAYNKQEKIMKVFSIATLAIALLGLFALAAYNAKTRSREIAVRKILGASTTGILRLLNKEFVLLVVIANVISFAAAYLMMHSWLNDFAYRINIPIYLFLLTGLLSMVLTIITVSWQAYKAAVANPVDALKYE